MFGNFLLSAPRPPSRSVQILHKIEGGGALRNVQKILKGYPYYSLHISKEGGGLKNVQNYPALYFFLF